MPGKGWVRSLFQRPEMVDHLEKEFKRADTSRDGKLQVGELHKALMVVVWQLKQAGDGSGTWQAPHERHGGLEPHEVLRCWRRHVP